MAAAVCGVAGMVGVNAAAASDGTLKAEFNATIAIFNSDRRALHGAPAITRMRTHMIIRRAILSADAGESARGRAARSLALQALNEIVDALAIDIRIADNDPQASITAYASHWTTGVQLLHAAGVQLGLFH